MDILHLAAPCRNVPVTFTLAVKKTALKRGDVLRRELVGGAVAVVRVAYVSGYFKHVVLVALYAGADIRDATDVLAKAPVAYFYTGRDSLLHDQGWERVGSTPELITDRASSRRLVAGDVWLEDECLGPAKGVDENLPNMDVYGTDVLQRKMAHALHG